MRILDIFPLKKITSHDTTFKKLNYKQILLENNKQIYKKNIPKLQIIHITQNITFNKITFKNMYHSN